MRENSFIVKLLLLVLLLTGFFMSCQSSKSISPAQISMKGNPTTGYTWEYTIENESIISVEQFEQYLGGELECGAPSQFTWKITGLKEGFTIIHFVYRRPWEKENPPENSVDYKIIVDENLLVSIEEI